MDDWIINLLTDNNYFYMTKFYLSAFDKFWLYFRYITGTLSIDLYQMVTGQKLKENDYLSLKKPMKNFGTEFGFNLRQNELRISFQESFEHLNKFNVDWLRTDFPMGYNYEPDFKFADKIVSECQRRRIKLLFVLGSGMSCNMVKTPENEQDANKFVRLVSKIAKRYKGKVSAYEIWNEPNLSYFWKGSLKDFIELLKRTSFAMKKETNSFLGFTLAYYHNFNKYFEKFDSKETLANIDFFAIHSYPGSLEPGDHRVMKKRISDIRRILKKKNCDIQIWVTEIGFVAFNSPNLSFHNPKNQTRIFRGACKIFKRNKISVVTWYRMRDAPVINFLHKFDPYENRWGLLKKNFEPKDSKIFEIITKRLMFK